MDHASLRRYSRQILVPEVGVAGQERLLSSSVLVVGAGGLGSTALLQLVAAGVGRVGIAEHDKLDASNLQRQVLYAAADVGKPKAELAAERLKALNPGVTIELHGRLEAANATDLAGRYDVVVDASDNFPTRYLLNDACVALGKSWVWGAAQGMDGMASVFGPGLTLRDAFPEPGSGGEDCGTVGVFGPLLAVVGGLMAVETAKLICGLDTLRGNLWTYDALSGAMRSIRLRPGAQVL